MFSSSTVDSIRPVLIQIHSHEANEAKILDLVPWRRRQRGLAEPLQGGVPGEELAGLVPSAVEHDEPEGKQQKLRYLEQ